MQRKAQAAEGFLDPNPRNKGVGPSGKDPANWAEEENRRRVQFEWEMQQERLNGPLGVQVQGGRELPGVIGGRAPGAGAGGPKAGEGDAAMR